MREWLIKAREAKMLSQSRLAECCDLSQQVISQFESGLRTPSVSVSKKIANALGFEWQLFYLDENDEQKIAN